MNKINNMKILPLGNRILVLPTTTEYQKTEGGIEVQNDLTEGIVVEVSDDLSNLYSVGDTILYPNNSGHLQYYNGKSCIWLNGQSQPQGDVWGKIIKKKYE